MDNRGYLRLHHQFAITGMKITMNTTTSNATLGRIPQPDHDCNVVRRLCFLQWRLLQRRLGAVQPIQQPIQQVA